MSESPTRTGRVRSLVGGAKTGTLVRVVIVLVVAVMPYYLGTALLQTGLFVFSAAIAAIGLNLLTGNTGQLSLGHAFFVMVGAYVYAYLSGGEGVQGGNQVSGLGLPAILALIGAVLVAGLFGLLFSPIASRLRGIYLGIASLALVFVGQHVAFNASRVTGGFYGRRVEPFDVFGFHFADTDPYLTVLGVQFGQFERLWYVGLVLLVIAYLFAKNLLRGRPGRSMEAVRDGEVAAAVIGVNVRRTKAAAFVISSMYAGLAGVVFALTVQRAVPDTFDFGLTIEYLAMIVIGGIGSVGGAVLGAIVVGGMSQLLTQYSNYFPFLSEPGSGGVDPGTFSAYVFGALVILVLLFEPRGLVAIGQRLVGRRAKGEVPGVISPPSDPVAA